MVTKHNNSNTVCIVRWALTTWGDKFSAAEVDDIFGEFEVDDDGFIDGKTVCGLFVAGGGEEKKEEVLSSEYNIYS